MINLSELKTLLEEGVDKGIIPVLIDYISVPSLSPLFDPYWETNGLMEKAQNILISYFVSLEIKGFSYGILKEPGKPWMFYGEVEPTSQDLGTVLIYGHMDKQPHFPNWIEGCGNTTPKIIDNKLYGRGGADNGYAIPSAALLIKTIQTMGLPHGRFVILGESEEESGSPNLVYFVNQLKDKIGNPDLIICLDSNSSDYEHLWIVSSIRGILTVDLTAKIIRNGMHSGECSGIVPCTFRICRQLLDRVEDPYSGEIVVPELHGAISPLVYEKASLAAKVLGNSLIENIEWEENAGPITDDIVQCIINRTLKPILCVTGADGLPHTSVAGNVLRPFTTLKLSFRLPPSVNCEIAFEKVREILTRDPPYNASVTVRRIFAGNGFNPSEPEQWMLDALKIGSNAYFNSEVLYNGGGGSIPFMGVLGNMFPKAKFIVTGVLGPNSNAHSANEFLHISFLKKLLSCLGVLIAAHGQRKITNF